MSAGNAIVARLGIDATTFKRDLANAEVMTKASAQRMSREVAAAQRQQQAGTKALLGKALGGGELLSGLEGAFGLSLGGAAIGASLVTLIPKLIDIGKEAAQARSELQLLLHPNRPAEFASLDELEKRVAGLQKAIKDAADTPAWKKFFQGLAGGALTAGTGGSIFTALKGEDEDLSKATAALADAQAAQEKIKRTASEREAQSKKMKGLSAEAASDAETALKNVNAEISAARTLADIEGDRAGDKHDAEEAFQKLAEKGRAEMISGIREEQAARAKAAAALASGIEKAAQEIVGDARKSYIAGELAGPDARRQAKRDARRTRHAGEKFDRLTKGIAPGLLNAIAGKVPLGDNPLEATNRILGEIKVEITKLEIHNL